MTNYCILGTTKPFNTENDFFKALKDQIKGKTTYFFYNLNYPSSYFKFSWSKGYLVIDFYNTKTNREEHLHIGRKDFSYSTFAELMEEKIPYNLSILNKPPQPQPQPTRKTFLQILWIVIKWIFGALGWLLWSIIKVLWFIIKLPFVLLSGNY